MNNNNPYKRMYLVSEDEYVMMGKHPDQQARLNAIALQDERNVHYADKVDDDDNGQLVVATTTKHGEDACIGSDCAKDEANKLIARQLKFHDEKHMHVAKDVAKEEKEIEDETLKWTNVPLDTARWDVLPQNIRTRAHLLITLVHRYAKVTNQQEFQHNTKAISGSNVFDLVRWALMPVRGRNRKAPIGWSEFLHFLTINKAIPRSILSKHTLEEIEQAEEQKPKRAKLAIVTSPFFKTLFKSRRKNAA
jgi:hypothetical protein